jgi:hypothetical protein
VSRSRAAPLRAHPDGNGRSLACPDVTRSVVLTLVGLWLGMLFASWGIATATFRSAEAVAATPPGTPAGDHVARVPLETRRPLFRHLASEINRWMFGRFGWAQLLLAVMVAGLAWSFGGAVRVLSLAALVAVVVQGAALGPAILELGRSIDFVARPLAPDVGRRFGMLHGGYVVLDLAKAAALIALAVILARRAG